MRYICLECSNTFISNEKKPSCPFCKNEDDGTIMKSLGYNEENRKIFEHILKRKNHSSAFLRMCGQDLIDQGYKSLGESMISIAYQKLSIESKLLKVFGASSDSRLNLAIVINRANEDVYLLKQLAEGSKEKIYYDLLKEEEDYYNLLCIISKRMLHYYS